MSYYRYVTSIYKSYWPELNRTLRSSSVPRHVPEPGRYVRGTSLPPDAMGMGYSHSPPTHITNAFLSTRRAASVAPSIYSRTSFSPAPTYRSSTVAPSYTSGSHYTDFDCKVMSYSAELDRQETLRQSVSRSKQYTSDYTHDYHTTRQSSPVTRTYPQDSFSSRYDYYAGNKHGSDGLYPCSREVLGTWKHYNLSADTLNQRNARARSPLISRELDRYYETTKRSNYIGDISSGGSSDFRHYNYRRVPYFGGSDNYTYMKQNPRSALRGF